MPTMRPVGYIVLTVKIHKEGKKWFAVCEELGTSTFANSFSEAGKRIEEAMILHLNALEDVGECNNFFREHNIKFYEHRPKRNDLTITGPVALNTYATPYVYPIHKELLGFR